MLSVPSGTLAGLFLWCIFSNPGGSQASQPQLLDFSSPNALPACANQCQPLYTAQYACIPPQAPVSDDAAYRSCFCQSAFLHNLYSTPAGLCDGICPPDGLAQIRNWYVGTCGQKAVASPSAATSAGTSVSSSSTPTGSNAGGTRTPSPTSTAFMLPTNQQEAPQQGWWSTHWKWVLMVIILFFAIIGGAVAGVLFKRYRKRKNAAAAEQPIVWGPHQHQHFTLGYTYDASGSSKEARPSSRRQGNRNNREITSGKIRGKHQG